MSGSRRARPWLWLLLAVAILFAAESLWIANVGPRPRRPWAFVPSAGCPAERHVAGQADYNWSLRSLDGAEVPLASFQGKVLFLNVWATWCGPCVAEMPSIQKLHESLKGQDVTFVLVSEEKADTVSHFVQRQEFTVPVYVSAGKLPQTFNTPGIPATFIVDRDGSIVYRHVGAADWNSAPCRDFLHSLIGSSLDGKPRRESSEPSATRLAPEGAGKLP